VPVFADQAAEDLSVLDSSGHAENVAALARGTLIRLVSLFTVRVFG